MRFLLSLLLGVAGVVSQGANEADDLLSQLSAKGYDDKTAPVGTTLADEMLDHVSGGVGFAKIVFDRWDKIA